MGKVEGIYQDRSRARFFHEGGGARVGRRDQKVSWTVDGPRTLESQVAVRGVLRLAMVLAKMAQDAETLRVGKGGHTA